MIDEIEKINFLIKENADVQFLTDLNDHLPTGLYETIHTINEGFAEVRFLVKEKDGIAEELIMIVEEEKTSIIMSIDGSFKISNLRSLSEKIDADDIINLSY